MVAPPTTFTNPQEDLTTGAPSDPVEPTAPSPDPDPQPEADTDPASKKKKKKQKRGKKNTVEVAAQKRRHPRRPLFPFLRVFLPGLVTLAALGAGGYYAWENYLKPEEKPREFVFEDKEPPSFRSASVNAQDILRFLPEQIERGFFVDTSTTFNVWQTTMNPTGEPVYNPIDDFVFESTGVGLAQLEYVCIAGNADISDFVAVAGFGIDLNPAELFASVERSGARLIRVEAIGEVPLRVLQRDGRELELVLVDTRTILVTSPGNMRKALKASERSTPNYGPITSSLGKLISDESAIAITGTPEAMMIGDFLGAFGCPPTAELQGQINSMEAVSIAVSADTALEATISFTAADASQAAQMTPTGTAWLSSAPTDVRKKFREEYPNSPLPGAFDRLLQGAEWATARNTNRIRLQVPRRDIASLIRSFQSLGEDDQSESEIFRRDAEDFASLFASGIACGNPDLPKAGGVEKALEMLCDGIRGRGEFDDVEVRHPDPPSPAERRAIAQYLEWKDGELILRR